MKKILVELYSENDINLFIKYYKDFLQYNDQLIIIHYKQIPQLNDFSTYFIDISDLKKSFELLFKRLNLKSQDFTKCNFSDERILLIRNIAKKLNVHIYSIESFLEFYSKKYHEDNFDLW